MKQIIITLLCHVGISLIFTSCEFELNGVFENEINKPNETHPGEINLNFQSDTIYIFEPTDISYSLNPFGLKANGLQIKYLNTIENNLHTPTGQFRITPDFSQIDWFDLHAIFYLGTGSGSIADRFKVENYVGTKTWKVKFIDFKKFDFKTGMQVNKDGYLEIFWIKPQKFPNIKSHINYSYTIHPKITKISGDTTFFTDSTYYGGNTTTYHLDLVLNSNVYTQIIIRPNYPFPEIEFTPIGLDSVLVSWTESPLNRYYKVYQDGWQRYIYTGTKNSFKAVVTPSFSQNFHLEIYPNNNARYNYKTIKAVYKIGDNADYFFAYAGAKNKFYITSPINSRKIEEVDIASKAGSDYAHNATNKNILRCNRAGTRFVAIYKDEIQVFDSTLNEINRIKVANASPHYGGQVTNNNTFGFYNYHIGIYTIVNIGTDNSWETVTFKPFTDGEMLLGYTDLSLDGNYLYWRGWTNDSFIIYDISNHNNIKQLYKCSISDINSLVNNTENSKEIIIGRKDRIEFRSVPSFELIRKIDLPGEGSCMVLNIDPLNNSLLTVSNNHFKIYRINDLELLLKFGGNNLGGSHDTGRLFKNNFFLNKLKTDISAYLIKK